MLRLSLGISGANRGYSKCGLSSLFMHAMSSCLTEAHRIKRAMRMLDLANYRAEASRLLRIALLRSNCIPQWDLLLVEAREICGPSVHSRFSILRAHVHPGSQCMPHWLSCTVRYPEESNAYRSEWKQGRKRYLRNLHSLPGCKTLLIFGSRAGSGGSLHAVSFEDRGITQHSVPRPQPHRAIPRVRKICVHRVHLGGRILRAMARECFPPRNEGLLIEWNT